MLSWIGLVYVTPLLEKAKRIRCKISWIHIVYTAVQALLARFTSQSDVSGEFDEVESSPRHAVSVLVKPSPKVLRNNDPHCIVGDLSCDKVNTAQQCRLLQIYMGNTLQTFASLPRVLFLLVCLLALNFMYSNPSCFIIH